MSNFPTDHRHKLCQALQKYAETHPEQHETADKMQEFISRAPNCFERSCQEGHITGSAWLISPDGNKALLTLHRKLGRWLQPGGHADGNPDTLSVALREATEESGIAGIRPLSESIFDIDIHLIPARPSSNEPAHYHYDVRYLLQAPHEAYNISNESDDLAWWSMEEIEDKHSLLDASVLRMAKRFTTISNIS